ncbi:P-loop containing nucleoside triphosphate hydrolase protein [Rhizoclosmatium globosum]|uniref:p-loop containing nucleoside triphosphate hydrolase protein n=1 Tax=Rhizoclosmatium globosum TaxID=329046 RepID=A0A1Y2C156_9FUNG|nr:Ras- protein Rab-35 [Rhizoclosmatium sp. JEL0117]ORY40696.1 P-loop containing nucleoside triphosphate hydrolase protein [Rhizoclosmatium globosum]|eukprot:ORY40696.1 P-loop containing nucleoside triphosphate hydrolase protein [Rhizoclosmatium globosum]
MAAVQLAPPLTQASIDCRKAIVVGAPGCGKTSLVNRAALNSFSKIYQQTYGADLVVKNSTDGKKGSLKIWCTGGHERYRALLEQFYQGIHVAILCFDLLNQASFTELPFWYNEIKRNAPDAFVILVGLKSDEADSVVIKQQDAIRQALDWNIEFRQVSAKAGTGVNELFEYVLDSVHKKR